MWSKCVESFVSALRLVSVASVRLRVTVLVAAAGSLALEWHTCEWPVSLIRLALSWWSVSVSFSAPPAGQ